VSEAAPVAVEDEAPAKPKRRSRAKKVDAEVETAADPVPAKAAPARKKVVAAPADAETVPASSNDGGSDDDQDGLRRSGWWQRTFG